MGSARDEAMREARERRENGQAGSENKKPGTGRKPTPNP
jgi:hypothetical protein